MFALVKACARKDLRRRLADRVTLAMWLGIPLVIGSLMSLAFGGDGGTKPRARVLVADEDDSFVSELLAGAFANTDGLTAVEPVDRERGLELMDAGDASALLIIPDGFGQAVLEDEPTTLELVTNPAQTILPGIVESMLEVIVDGGFYVQQVFGAPLATIVEGPAEGEVFENVAIAALAVQVNDVVRDLVDVLDPPLIELETAVDEPSDGGGGLDFGALMFPSMVFMALMFVAQGTSEDFWTERTRGTLRRLAVVPRGVAGALGGKSLAAAFFLLAVAAVGLLLGTFAFGLPLARLPLAALWAALSGTVLLLLFTLLQLFASSQRGGSILTNTVLFPLLMIGGSFFPFEAMPDWMAKVGGLTPNGWALLRFKEILAGELGAGPLLFAIAAAVVVGAILFTLCVHRLRRGFATAA